MFTEPRIRFRSLILSAFTLFVCESSYAAFLDLSIPREVFNFGTTCTDVPDPANRVCDAPAAIFDVSRPFNISSVGIGFGVEGSMNLAVSIYETAIVPIEALPSARGNLLASANGLIEGVRPTFPVGSTPSFRWFDIPLTFNFEADHRYEVAFSDFSFGDVVGTPDNWAFAAHGNSAYDVEGVLTVIGGDFKTVAYPRNLLAGIPMMMLDTDLTDIVSADRSKPGFGFEPIVVPEVDAGGTPLGIGLTIALISLIRDRRKCNNSIRSL